MLHHPHTAMTAQQLALKVNSPARLGALEATQMVDSETDEDFDRLTRLASKILNVPVSLVSLVNESKQFFKSSIGLPEPWNTQRETPLTHSFCQYVVASNEPLAIQDARTDPVLATNGATTEMGVVSYLGVPLQSAEGEPMGSFCVIDDKPHAWSEEDLDVLRDLARAVLNTIQLRVSLRRQTEMTQTVEVALDNARQALQAKQQFLANVSHELRTPLSGILGMSELLLATDLKPDQREFGNWLKLSADSLVTMVNELLDFSKFEAGQIELEPAPFQLRETLALHFKPLALRAHSKGLELLLEVDPDVPEDIIADWQRLRQILVNLVGNSLKFTEAGSVRVHVRRGGSANGATTSSLGVHVVDTGIGIDAAQLSRIFKPFQQADSSVTRKYGGTGLGLSISQLLAERMGGTIGCSSKQGHGSIFFFDFTYGLDLNVSRKPCIPRCTAVMRSTESARGLAKLFAWAGAEGRVITDVSELKISSQSTVFLELDGDEAQSAKKVELIRAGKPRQLILLTPPGWKAQPALEQALEGLARLSMPIQPSFLDVEDAGREPCRSQEAVAIPAAPGNILVADDNPVNLKVARAMLTRLGHVVELVEDGGQALEQLQRGVYDVAFIDIQMPVHDGLQVLELYRAQPAPRRTMLIALTAQAVEGDRQRFLDAGFDDYLQKPFTFARLSATVEWSLSQARKTGASVPLDAPDTEPSFR